MQSVLNLLKQHSRTNINGSAQCLPAGEKPGVCPEPSVAENETELRQP